MHIRTRTSAAADVTPTPSEARAPAMRNFSAAPDLVAGTAGPAEECRKHSPCNRNSTAPHRSSTATSNAPSRTLPRDENRRGVIRDPDTERPVAPSRWRCPAAAVHHDSSFARPCIGVWPRIDRGCPRWTSRRPPRWHPHAPRVTRRDRPRGGGGRLRNGPDARELQRSPADHDLLRNLHDDRAHRSTCGAAVTPPVAHRRSSNLPRPCPQTPLLGDKRGVAPLRGSPTDN